MAKYLQNSTNETCEYNNTEAEYNGLTCAPHVLYKGNMDYLRKSITDDWKSPGSSYYR